MEPAVQELFQHLARHVAEPLLGVSTDGTVLLSCPAAARLVGRSEAELRGLPLSAFVADPPEKAAEYLRLCSRSLVPLPGALKLLHASGQEVHCRCRGALLSRPNTPPAVILLRLIPKEGAQSPFALLNQKIADLTREVTTRKRAEQEALAALQVRDEFLAVASHEFKTPLHSLKLQLELVVRALAGLDAFTQKRLGPRVDAMRRQVERLSVLSASLLDLTAMRAGQVPFKLEPQDLEGTVRSVVDGLATKLAHAGCAVRLDLEPNLVAFADASRLEQILVNLLSNALKYGAGRPILVATRTKGEKVQLSVTDRGIGIAPEDLPRIFGRFERAVSSENYGGLGLGLYICSQLAEGMHGRITAESTVGEGSTFVLELPRAPAQLMAVDP